MTDDRPHSWHEPPELSLLPADSYTAHKLRHATPEHLHLTSRRFFIGPIPEGWLRNHRRDWYKHHLHLNYSSRAATFSSDPRDSRQRRLTGLEGPSSSALFSHSFPQPEDLSAEEEEQEQNGQSRGSSETPVTKNGAPPALQIPRGSDQKTDIVPGDDKTEYIDAESEPDEDEDADRVHEADAANASRQKRVRRTSTKSFVTASTSRSVLDDEAEHQEGEAAQHLEDNRETSVTEQASGLQVPTSHKEGASRSSGKRPASTVGSTNGAMSGLAIDAPSVEITSTSSLLRKADSHKTQSDTGPTGPTIPSKFGVRKRSEHATSTAEPLADHVDKRMSRTKSQLRNLVKFDIPEDSRRAELALKAKSAQMTIQRASTKLRRSKIKDGLVVKMERMLVRVDTTSKDVPPDFDENSNQKTDSHVQEKWREYMVVCRQHDSDYSDFVLQMYKTRVIPEIEKPNNKKRATYEIPLGRKVSKANLYSNLDKSVVVWLPSSKNTKIFIMQARTASNAVEWYTFLRNVQGWRRASELQINIPDMSVSLRIDNPFEKLEMSHNIAQEASDDEEAILNTMKEEQAVAQNLIKRCLHMLGDSPEWRDVLDSWVNHQRMGLAWKRYDRLEWIHGSNERKMFGTIAMQKSHELELRPKSHYPTTAVTQKKKKTLTEPSPVEGFLIRLTSQRGRARRLGLMYHKQLYFQSHDQFLIFSRPPKVTPPPPPKLPASQNSRVPSAHDIVDKTPDNWTVDPYPLKDGEIEWLIADHSGTPGSRRLHDRDAEDEGDRKARNLLNCDGYISLANIVKVRKAKIGDLPVDEHIESGSDVDFDAEVDDSPAVDGATKEFNVERTFELILKNGLIIRLQAADEARRKQWVKHLRALAKYWKHRTTSDITLHKSTRSQNLAALNIDEEAEAFVGQFAQKWEVTQSYASSQLYNLCGIASCRSIHMSGILYRKPRIHAAFARCSVILAAGSLLIFQDVLRSRSGKELAHIHHERIANLDLKDCYIYSGLLTESDLLYQNQTFDSNKPGHHALPRIYLNDGWTSTDEDVMTTFVVWHGKSKSWFRAEEGAGGGEKLANQGKRTRLKRVAKLGSKGRSVVFRARSRAERDHWVLAIQNEIEKVQEGGADFRIEEMTGTA